MFSLLQSYFQSLWTSLYETLFSPQRRPARLLVLGLDNAGKTTLLQALRSGGGVEGAPPRSYPPTDRPEHLRDILTLGNISFSAYDLGGHEAVRHLWSDYYDDEDAMDDAKDDDNEPSEPQQHPGLAILFCLDASDHDRLEEAAYELDALLHTADGNRRRRAPPLAILLTKCDALHPLSTTTGDTPLLLTTEQVSAQIDYPQLQQEYKRIRLFRISVYEHTGYMEALQWIASVL